MPAKVAKAAKSPTKAKKARTKRKPAKAALDRRTRSTPTPTAAPTEKLLDMQQAIELLKTTRPTFYRWLRTGKIRGMKVGRQWRFEPAEIDRFLKGEAPRIELRADIGPFVEELRKRAEALGAPALPLPEETDVQAAIAEIFRIGVAMRATDVHIHPLAEEGSGARAAVVRYRVDGVLQRGVEFDIRLLAPVMQQWKAMGACDPQQVKRPQDARMMFEAGGARIDLRLSFLPCAFGESLTVRILRPNGGIIALDDVGYADADRDRLARALGSPWGLILLTGPTGSGKTTTLYACLSHVAGPEVKVITSEAPVEYVFPWMIQTQLDPAEGVSLARLARSALRADPDVIMIGELRDPETANLSLQAALTGHLVLTTLHANDTARALVRLVEMDCPPFVVADATKLVLSQRLVRLLCPHCSRETVVEPQRLARAGQLARTGGIDWDALPKHFRAAVGCDQCKHLGYRGRNVVTEVLEVTPEIGQALRLRASVEELRAIAVSQGMTTMAADGVRRAAAGETSLDEVLRVLAGLTGLELKT